MQKLLLIPLLWGVLEAQELTPSQMKKTTIHNHSLLSKIKYQRLLRSVATLNKEDAHAIAKKASKEEVAYSQLKKHSRRLFYVVSTKSYKIKIDALDGSIMSKEER